IYVQIAISEQEYLRWSRRGATERLRDLGIVLADGTTYPHRGTAEILDRDVGRTTGTINLRGVFPNPGELLRPGQFVKVRAVVDLRKDALLVPQRSVQDLQGLHQVAVVGADETVDVRRVQLGQRVGSFWTIEQQMSGVDNMLYMYSTSQTSGSEMNLRVSFDIATDPNIDQVLVNMRYSQAASQLPPDVVNQGVSVRKSVLSPLALFVLHSPKGTYDELFLSNYAYVNLNDPMTRVPGVGQVLVFGANKYAIRFWVNPDTLAKLDITVNEIVRALQ